MVGVGRFAACLAASICAAACARPDTVVQLSGAHDVRWEVRDADDEHLCWLPCNVELDEHEWVTVARNDGRARFVLRQQDLGQGTFSGTLRPRKKDARGTVAARALAAALSGAGSVLTRSDDDEHRAWGIILSSVGAATDAVTDVLRAERHELWVQRTSTP